MKINWALRFKNKQTLAALAATVISAAYQVLGILGVVAPISQGSLIQLVGIILTVLAGFGVIVDPTTKGASDSKRAMSYSEPHAAYDAKAVEQAMSITQREAFAQVMEHLVSHDGGGGHGYSQANRMGDGTTETICLSDGTTVTIAGGDRDCSSAVVTALRAVGVNTFGASYTGNMREQLLKTGLFGWRKMGVKSAQRGDIYLNEKCHTAVCVSPYGSARGDLLAQFSISEKGTVTGTKGDQTGRESNIKAYYSYPWDGTLYWLGDGKTLNGSNTEVADNTVPSLGDTRYFGPKMAKELQRQLGTTADGVISGQWPANERYLWACDRGVIEYVKGGVGSNAVRALQDKVGCKVYPVVGGVQARQMGSGTVFKHQQWLIAQGISCGSSGADGYQGRDTNVAIGQALVKQLYR